MLYAAIWSVIAALPLALELWAKINGSGFEWRFIIRWWIGMVPLVVLFLIHNHILIPKYLKNGQTGSYGILLLVLLLAYGGCQYAVQKHVRKEWKAYAMAPRPDHRCPPPAPFIKPGPEIPGSQMPPRPFPIPILFKIMLAALTLGINAAISLAFTYNREQSKRKEIENHRLQEELKYLRQQISPHFFMNVLNNIHEMAEEDIKAAQDMILELSHLMRHILYESENDMTDLVSESRFISSYVSLMKMRYVGDMVEIGLELPENASENAYVPPLLFVSFIENAFKHGVSYQRKTSIRISLHEKDGRIHFRCENTLPPKDGCLPSQKEGGVGLSNLKRRLDLLYGGNYSLNITHDENIYSITLTIPCR